MKYCPHCGAPITGSAASFCANCGKRQPPAKTKPRSQRKKTITQSSPASQPGLPEDGYDGYSDDVPPMDVGEVQDGLPPETLKRILLIAAGALVLIILAGVAAALL